MLLTAFGTRPEWIKIKPVIDEIEGEIPFKILFTGQHTSLVDLCCEFRVAYTPLQFRSPNHWLRAHPPCHPANLAAVGQ